jgi:hypothetical protein
MRVNNWKQFLNERKINESNIDVEKLEDILLNVRDILLPISDMGYNIVVDGCFNTVANAPHITISVIGLESRSSLKMTDEVREEFIRMKEYLVSEGFGSIKAIYISSNPFSDTNFLALLVKQGHKLSGRVFFDDFISLKGGEFKKLEFSIFPNYR